MKLIRANEANKEQINHFLRDNPNFNQDRLYTSGYVVKQSEEIIGCFILELIKDEVYWLKQLYITQSKATFLPLLLESILLLAKNDEAKEVCVKSHQPMVDILLEALQFQPTKQATKSNERWWTYNVS